MDYFVAVAEKGNYVICRVLQQVTTERAIKFTMAASAFGDKHNINRFLFDLRESCNVESNERNYNYVNQDIAKLDLGLDKSGRAALLVSPEDTSHDVIETLSREAGYNVRVFTHPDAAISWLSEANDDSSWLG